MLTARCKLSVAVLVAGGLGVAMIAVGQPARAAGSFAVSAAADGIWTDEQAPGVFPLGLWGNGGGPTAQAGVDSIGNSTGFAASPHPGDAALSVPQVLAAFPVPVPAYPLAVSSSFPHNPDASNELGAISLAASSSATSSHAAATSGAAASPLAVPSGTSTALADGSIRSTDASADASATADGISFEGVLVLAHVHAEAHASRTSGGQLKRSSTLEIGAATIAGVPVTITDQGIAVAGTSVPVSASDLIQALADQGVAVSVVPESRTPTGVVSGALKVTITQTLPVGGPIQATYIIGFASAAVFAGNLSVKPPASVSSLQLMVGTPKAPTGRAHQRAPATGGGAAVVPTGNTVAEGPVDILQAQPLAPGGALSRPDAPALTSASGALHRQPAAKLDALDLYVVLACAALVMLGTAQLVRYLGVRSTWIS